MAADRVTLTIAEAAGWLDPPISRAALAAIVAALAIPAAGTRAPVGRRGRPAKVYDAAELMRLHAAVAPWLTVPDREDAPSGT